MKKDVTELANFALRVNRKKFAGLSVKKQHELIAAMAYTAGEVGLQRFLKRYDEFHQWADLDRFSAPDWLTEKEALLEFYRFHKGFVPHEQENEVAAGEPAAWKPVFNVRVFLDQIRSPFNAGSVLRLIDNFGFAGLIHSSPDLNMEHPRLKKTARGCQRWIPVEYEPDPIRMLKAASVPVIGIEQAEMSVEPRNWQPPESCILVCGNEEYGISDAILACCNEIIEIPVYGYKRSMNIHHALAVIAHRFTEASR